MGRKTIQAIQKAETETAMQMDYLMSACYYFHRAEGADENLVSALNRMRAGELKQRMEYLGVKVPDAEEIRAYAADRWPAHKLHA